MNVHSTQAKIVGKIVNLMKMVAGIVSIIGRKVMPDENR